MKDKKVEWHEVASDHIKRGKDGEDFDLRCPLCGYADIYPWKHYRYCDVGLEMERMGYVISFVPREDK